MTAHSKRPIAASAPTGLANVPASSQFEAQLAGALAACTMGRRAALLHLDVARAVDIRHRCGNVGCQALHERIYETLPARRSGSRSDPILASALCGFTLLLQDCAPDNAMSAAERLRRAVDESVFRWHGHQFSLGVHVGVVELGPAPVALRPWLEAVREASIAARELGGTGVALVEYSDRAWMDIAHEREWHDHLREVLA